MNRSLASCRQIGGLTSPRSPGMLKKSIPRVPAARIRLLGVTVAALLIAASLQAADIDYERDVKPLLAKKCTGCHGAVKQEGGLRLDAAVLIRKGGDSGPVVAKDANGSELIARVAAADAAMRMPPEGEGEALNPRQIDILRRWIDAGLPAPEDELVLSDPGAHWAYQTPQRPEVPRIGEAVQAANPVDAFLSARQHEQHLAPLPEADRATLLRRVSLDLIGLPPTRAELHAFLADESPDAYEKIVDRLLMRPEHGERWGRHWMDVWRYSDWDGYRDELRGSQRHIWRWRDWIVESLNADKGYDRMIVEMLAGDELAPTDPDVLRATGFLARNYYKFNRDHWLDNVVEHTGKAFLGTTFNCAKCHDHKYDPIAQADYYQMRAFFEPYQVRTDRVPDQPDVNADGLPRAYDAKLDEPTYLFIRGNEKQPDKEHPLNPALPEVFAANLSIVAVPLPREAWYPDLEEPRLQQLIEQAAAEVVKAEQELTAARAQQTAAAQTPNDPAAIAAPPTEDGASTPGALEAASTAAAAAAERALHVARAAAASLSARIAADRAKHADPPAADAEAKAIEAARAERALHLLRSEAAVVNAEQQLAPAQSAGTEEAARQKAVEKAQQELAKAVKARDEAQQAAEKTDGQYTPLGPAYPRTSTGRRLALARWITSPSNPLAARVAVNHIWLRHFGAPLVENTFDFGLQSPPPELQPLLDWLAVEFVDSGWSMKHLHRMLVTSQAYRRASSSGGHAIEDSAVRNRSIDSENRCYWRANVRRLDAEVIRDAVLAVSDSIDPTRGGPDIEFAQGETVLRRSLYFRHAYEKQMTLLVLFDGANPNECYRRTQSIIPQQALALANSGLTLAQSRKLAGALSRRLAASQRRAQPSHEGSDDAFIDAAFEHVLSRSPSNEEAAACAAFLTKQAEQLQNPDALTSFDGGAAPATPAAAEPAQRARENLVHVLMNHNDFVTVR